MAFNFVFEKIILVMSFICKIFVGIYFNANIWPDQTEIVVAVEWRSFLFGFVKHKDSCSSYFEILWIIFYRNFWFFLKGYINERFLGGVHERYTIESKFLKFFHVEKNHTEMACYQAVDDFILTWPLVLRLKTKSNFG